MLRIAFVLDGKSTVSTINILQDFHIRFDAKLRVVHYSYVVYVHDYTTIDCVKLLTRSTLVSQKFVKNKNKKTRRI